MNEIIETLKNADNEATRCPYWLILDPSQNMTCDPHYMAHGITGPFFSREDAEGYRSATRHHYSDKAVVYCLSGHHSRKYESLCRAAGI